MPNDVDLNGTSRQVVILTGPNMGGKSTYLRQTALLPLLAQIGSFVPARDAKLPLVDRIFARVGASDNIARGHSTFMVEMQETAHILHTATSRSLVVLDEIGRGTSTFDGLSIAWAVAEYLASPARQARPKTLFATHYHELTDLADAQPGVVNAHVAAREWKDDIIFLRKIIPGRADRSYGIQVARLAGLPPVGDRPRQGDPHGLEHDELSRGGRPTLSGPAAAGVRQLGALLPAATPRPIRGCTKSSAACARSTRITRRRGRRSTRSPSCGSWRRTHDGATSRMAVLLLRRAGRLRSARTGARPERRRRGEFGRRRTTSIRARPTTRPRSASGSSSSARCMDVGARPAGACRTWRSRLDNPDPLTYVAHLRRGVQFHDGHELTSKDVVYTYAAFLDPGLHLAVQGRVPRAGSRSARSTTTPWSSSSRSRLPPSRRSSGVPPIVPAGSGDAMRTFPDRHRPVPVRQLRAGRQRDAVGVRGLLGRAAEQRRHRAQGRARRHDARARAAQGHRWTSWSTTCRPTWCTSSRRGDRFAVQRDPGLDFSYIGVNMRDPVLKDKRVRHAIGYAINRDAIVTYLRRGLARPAIGLVPPQAWAFEPDVHTFTYDPARAKALLDEAGYRDPDGDGPLPRLRLSLKISTNEETRLQSTVIQQDLRRVGIDLDVRSYEFATLLRRRAQGRLPDLLAAVGRRRAGRPRHPAARLPLAAGAAGRLQPRLLQQPRGRSADRRGVARAHRRGTARATTPQAQRLIAEDAPYIPIWNRVNVILAQPGLRRPAPAADGRLPGAQGRALGTARRGALGRAILSAAGYDVAALSVSSPARASCTYGESGCWSTIWVKVCFASAVLPLVT